MKDHLPAGIVSLVMLLLMVWLGGGSGLIFFVAFFFLLFLPGYLLLMLTDITPEVRAIIAIPLSYSLNLLHYLLSRIGIASVNIAGLILVYALVGAVFFLARYRMDSIPRK